ncbi:uncharacterized protein LOC126661128 isoform X2 [Mercurialis annua]|uniref:uncharacterized protein LOC126661128 isoform X2 n=1 Tax=Mercurialis annua TaxID=3986 RepID=UPI00215F1A2E|nr:uncharacterized protein LOC126661128 isoform X2 [Mercurialis annua]
MVATRRTSDLQPKPKIKTRDMKMKTVAKKTPKSAKGKSTGEASVRRSPISLNKRHAEHLSGLSKKQKGVCINEPKESAPKLWQFKLNPAARFHSKIDTCLSYDVITEIKSTLSPGELELFKKSCLGYIIDIPKIKLQNQIVHCLLMREVEQLNKSEMWFHVGGHRLKFGIEEFALVSGLNCQGTSNKYSYPKVLNGLYDKYFSGCQSVSKQTLRDMFLSRRWESEEDGFKLAFMHLLQNFLLASPNTTRISLKDFDVVDSDDINDYPWGIDVFKYTFDCFTTKSVLSPGSFKQDINRYDYRLQGFPYVLQCWFYECCSKAKNTFAQLVNETAIPRILRWQAFIVAKYYAVDRELFAEVSSDEVSFRSIVPTPAERNALNLGDFFRKNKGKGKAGLDVSEEVGNQDGYFPAIDLSKESEETSNTLNLSVMEEKLEFLMAGQKTMQADILEFKHLFTSKFSEVLKVVNSLNSNIKRTGDSKKVHSQLGASSSPIGNKNDDDKSYSGGKPAEHEHHVDSEYTASAELEPVLKVRRSQKAASSAHTASVVKEENVDLPAEESSKKGSFNGSFMGSGIGVEDSVDCQKVTPDKDIADKSASKHESDEGGSSDEEQGDEKLEDMDKEMEDVVGEKMNVMESEHVHNLVEEKIDVIESGFDKELPKVSNMEAAGCSKDMGISGGNFAVPSVVEVPRQPQFSPVSPTFDLSEECIEEAMQNAMETIAKMKSQKDDYVQANFGLIVPKQSIGSVCLCPFDEKSICFSDVKKQEQVRLWLDEGRMKPLKKKIYDVKNDILRPRLHFGVVDIESKTWFYNLFHSGYPISCSHVDVLFYYLRKKIKTENIRCATTDNFFDRRMQAIYDLYSKKGDTTFVSEKNTVSLYMKGGFMRCNTKWSDVDDVLIPINCKKDWHWILARLNFKDRCIYVYNSLRSARQDKSANEYVKCYSELVPILLEEIKFFDSRPDIDTTTGPYEGKRLSDPFRIENVENLPVQTDIDCGVHMFCAAEFFVKGKVMGPDFDIKQHRARYASALYLYSTWKADSVVESDDEAPPRLRRVGG